MGDDQQWTMKVYWPTKELHSTQKWLNVTSAGRAPSCVPMGTRNAVGVWSGGDRGGYASIHFPAVRQSSVVLRTQPLPQLEAHPQAVRSEVTVVLNIKSCFVFPATPRISFFSN